MLCVGILEHLQRSDRYALDKPRVRRSKFKTVNSCLECEIVAITPFCQDDAALAINRFLLDQQFTRGLPHQHQRGFQQVLVIARQIEHIERTIKASAGIGVCPERKSFTFEQRDHFALGNPF